jgi:transcription-repair coupling factor (superfamily II helicase)
MDSVVVKNILNFNAIDIFLQRVKKGIGSFKISTLPGSSKAILTARLSKNENQLVVLFPDIQNVSEFNVELDVLGASENCLVVTEFNPEEIQEKLTDLSHRESFILISTYELLKLKIPSKKTLTKNTTKIETGGDFSYNDLIEYLNLLNYQRDKFVEAPGDFAVRGSIVDFWSYSEKNPVRIEFDGDFIESIRYFDSDSQRSIENVNCINLSGKLSEEEDYSSDIFEYLNNPLILSSTYDLMNQLKESDINTEELINKNNVRWVLEEAIPVDDGRIELGLSDSPTINSNYKVLEKILEEYGSKQFNIFITAENGFQNDRLKELLSELKPEKSGLSSIYDFIEKGTIKIETLPIKKGFLNKQENFLLLTDYEIFKKPYRSKIINRKKTKKSKAGSLSKIKRGDFVVHEDYGIGQYAGLETIKIGEVNQETMKILYSEGGIVYVNLNYLNLVKKYSSAEKLNPSLSTLGTSDWVNTKQKAKKKIKEAARELIELYAKRKASKGFSYSTDSVWQKELEASFLYEDTPDQEKVTDEVKTDMEAENPMDRLVCGDVGFGKTEIAVRAAFKAVQDGKQTAVLVPTTILAEQHYNTFKDRLSQFPVKVDVLSRFQPKKKQTEIVKDLSDGNVDVIIGTHRLLSKDINLHNLGLLIIDEEHRFGVMAKEKLRSMKLNVDTLTLTATPIPRTLNLSLLGARDLSIIATPPPNRQPIYTSVSTFDIIKIREWVLNELKRNGQIYFVHDRVQTIDKFAAYLQKHLPDVKIGIAHGQMKPSQLEKVIHKFLNREYDILLSTKIIESGIDIPNVNTIIVNRADKFGLAELHQLRGRVGRSNRQAFAHFIVPSLETISKKALRRLQAIEEFTDVGAGFNISMRDLEIRGAGNLLGTEQTGFINDVGFDLYIKLINEAVEELKYQEFKEVFKSLPKHEERTEPTIDTFFEIGIPAAYMPEQAERLDFYTALYSIKSIAGLNELKDEMIDRFGPLPVLVSRLVSAAELKFYASYALFQRIIIQRKNIFLILPKGEKEDYYKYKFVELMRFIMENYRDTIKFNQQKDVLKLVINNNFETPEKMLEFLIKFSREAIDLFNIEIKEPAAEEVYN